MPPVPVQQNPRAIGQPYQEFGRDDLNQNGKGRERIGTLQDDGMSAGVERIDKPPGLDLLDTRNTVHTYLKDEDDLSSLKLNTEYDPIDGFDIYFDYISKLFAAFQSVRIVYSMQNVNDQIFEPVMIQRVNTTIDSTDNTMNAAIIK